jgi:hypothetical protein
VKYLQRHFSPQGRCNRLNRFLTGERQFSNAKRREKPIRSEAASLMFQKFVNRFLGVAQQQVRKDRAVTLRRKIRHPRGRPVCLLTIQQNDKIENVHARSAATVSPSRQCADSSACHLTHRLKGSTNRENGTSDPALKFPPGLDDCGANRAHDFRMVLMLRIHDHKNMDKIDA